MEAPETNGLTDSFTEHSPQAPFAYQPALFASLGRVEHEPAMFLRGRFLCHGWAFHFGVVKIIPARALYCTCFLFPIDLDTRGKEKTWQEGQCLGSIQQFEKLYAGGVSLHDIFVVSISGMQATRMENFRTVLI